MSDEIKYAVYVIAIEDTNEAFEAITEYGGIHSFADQAHHLTSEEAETIVDNLASWNCDALAQVWK